MSDSFYQFKNLYILVRLYAFIIFLITYVSLFQASQQLLPKQPFIHQKHMLSLSTFS